MNTSSDPTLFDIADPHANRAHTSINPTLWFQDCDGYRVIFCRHEVLYRVALTDALFLAFIAVSLRQGQLATQIEIAKAFGHSAATQRRWETCYCQHGFEGLRPKSPTGRRAKLDCSQRAFVQQWFQQGVSNLEMARRLGVSEATLRRVLRQSGLRRQTLPQPELPFDEAKATPTGPAIMPAPVADAAPVVEPATATVVPGEAVTPAGTEINANPNAAANVPAYGFTLDRDPTEWPINVKPHCWPAYGRIMPVRPRKVARCYMRHSSPVPGWR
jgi:transposase